MSLYPEFDLSTVNAQPISERVSKVRVEDFARPPAAGASFADFLSSLPRILAGPEIDRIAATVLGARVAQRAVIASLGGHVVKTGLSPVLIHLMERGVLTALAVNGALAIHDCEIAANGGVLMNLGSAVVLPEVLLKAIALLRNRHGAQFSRFLGVNFDFIQHYRSNQQVVSRVRSIGGDGVALTGHHEIMIPLLAQAIIERLAEPKGTPPKRETDR